MHILMSIEWHTAECGIAKMISDGQGISIPQTVWLWTCKHHICCESAIAIFKQPEDKGVAVDDEYAAGRIALSKRVFNYV